MNDSKTSDFLPDEKYAIQSADANTYEEVRDYYPEFSVRMLAEFVLRAEY